MKASLHLEAAQRPQWPKLYLLSRPMSRGRMPSLVGDGGQVLQVLGWALTRIRNLPLVRANFFFGPTSNLDFQKYELCACALPGNKL